MVKGNGLGEGRPWKLLCSAVNRTRTESSSWLPLLLSPLWLRALIDVVDSCPPLAALQPRAGSCVAEDSGAACVFHAVELGFSGSMLLSVSFVPA